MIRFARGSDPPSREDEEAFRVLRNVMGLTDRRRIRVGRVRYMFVLKRPSDRRREMAVRNPTWIYVQKSRPGGA